MSSPELQIGKAVEASTVDSHGKVGATSVVVYYDKNCGFCTQLAQLMSKSTEVNGIKFLPSTDSDPEELVVITDGQRLCGREAWSWLVEHHRMFREWNWLAAKIGLHEEGVTLIMRGAEVLRRMCPRCRRTSR